MSKNNNLDSTGFPVNIELLDIDSDRKSPKVLAINNGDGDDQIDGKRKRLGTNTSYAANKNVAEGMMDIALLSANANQLRFLITYNTNSSTYYISLVLIVLSLLMQIFVGIALIFKKKCSNTKRISRTNEFLIGGVFIITVVNILSAAFTTTDNKMAHQEIEKP